MLSSLRGKVYSVTGAASGIGRATALKIANSGAAAIALADVDEKGLQETESLCKCCFVGHTSILPGHIGHCRMQNANTPWFSSC